MTGLETKRPETQAMLDNADLLFNQEQCCAALQKVVGDITRDLVDRYPLLLPVMGGAVVFTGWLLPLLRFSLDFDYVHVSRYGDKLMGGAFNWKHMPDPEQIKGRHVVALDDALDEGHTMAATQEELLEIGVASCRATVFANKLIDKEKPTQADYIGLDAPNRYVFGYGMDAAGCWRNLGEIYALNNEQSQSRLKGFQTASNQHQEHVMTGLLIIVHEITGEACQGLAHHFFPNGFPENVCILGVQPNEDRSDIVNNAIVASQEFPDNHGVLIMTDIFDVTLCSTTRRLVCENKLAIPIGLNAPMMTKTIQHSSRAENLSDFTETVKEAVTRGIPAIISAPEDLACRENG